MSGEKPMSSLYVTGEKQSQLLVLGLSLEFDKKHINLGLLSKLVA